MSELRAVLEAAVASARVSTAPLDRVRYASDASFYRLVPRAVVWPASVEEVRGLFAASRVQRVPLVFRAAGTSLSGQAVTDGVLVDVSRHWRRVGVEDDGMRVRVQPGAVGAAVNAALKPFGRRMGPDPASIDACMLGGILANNASGMCCGVRQNAYHTLASLTMVLPDGGVWDSARDRQAFAATDLGRALSALADEVRADADLAALIRRKYAIKNTTGYGLNAFLDETEPLPMLARLMIGSEGTLGFIAEAVLNTVPDPPFRLAALLLFPSVADACAAVTTIDESGAAAIELMDRPCLVAVENHPGIPEWVKSVAPEAASLLVEYQAVDEAERHSQERRLRALAERLPLLQPPDLAGDEQARAALWKIRKGLFPAVGATRPPSTTVIIEDVAVPVVALATAVTALRALFARHGYEQGIVFGHARDGNLHFVISQSFNTPAEVARYQALIEDVVEMVVSYGGSLKAEHGTGRNMAPFVEREWGRVAAGIMRRLKRLVDVDGLLNPGVIITDDASAHVRHLKDCPAVSPVIDGCIECGFCEPRCPSRDLTLTPRQRIVSLREAARGTPLGAEAMGGFGYGGVDTCATDGLCAAACPVSIDTGRMVKMLRAGEPLPGYERGRGTPRDLARAVARRWAWIERGARMALRAGHGVRHVIGARAVNAIIAAVERPLGTRLPRWVDPMPRVATEMPVGSRGGGAWAEYVYLPSCMSRILGPTRNGESSVATLLMRLSARAGVRLWLPPDLEGTCCGMPFSSKGQPEAAHDAFALAMARLDALGIHRRLSLVVDASSCLLTYREQGKRSGCDRTFLDAVQFAHDVLLPRLRLRPVVERVAVHPPCSLVRSGLDGHLLAVASASAAHAEVPVGAGCCGTAGDRGLLYPALPAAATATEAAALRRGRYQRHVASNRTCEMGLAQATGLPFTSFLALLDDASREEG